MVDGDIANFQRVVASGGTGTVASEAVAIIFTANSNTYEFLNCHINSVAFSAGTTNYMPLAGNGVINTTEADVQDEMLVAGKLKHGLCYVSANSIPSPCQLQTRKNYALGKIYIGIQGSTTGLFEDVSSVDTVADGEKWNWRFATTGAGTSITLRHLSVGFETTNDRHQHTSSMIGRVQALNVTNYYTLSDHLIALTTETEAQVTSRLTGAVARETLIELATNTLASGNSTLTFRQNATTDSLSVSIAGGTTGTFNTTGATAIAVTDEINYKFVTPSTSGGSVTIQQISCLLDCGPITKTFTMDIHLIPSGSGGFDRIMEGGTTRILEGGSVSRKLEGISAGPTKTFTMDIVLLKTQTKTFTMDIVLKKVQTKTFTMDIVLKLVQTKTFTMDIVLKKVQTKTFTMDIVLLKTQTKTFTMDIVLKAVLTKTFTMDIYLITQGVGTKTFTFDIVLLSLVVPPVTKRPSIHTLDAGIDLRRRRAHPDKRELELTIEIETRAKKIKPLTLDIPTKARFSRLLALDVRTRAIIPKLVTFFEINVPTKAKFSLKIERIIPTRAKRRYNHVINTLKEFLHSEDED